MTRVRPQQAVTAGLAAVLLLNTCGSLTPRPTPSAAICETARQRVLSMPIFTRIDRIEAKRMTAKELIDGSRDQLPLGEIDPQTVVCVLAIAGDIRQPGGALPEPRTWSVHVSVEAPDQPLAAQYNSVGTWPAYFDGLPSR